MSNLDPFVDKARKKLHKMLRSCLTPSEEKELFRYFLMECQDDRIRAAMFRSWQDRKYGKTENRNLNFNANHNLTTVGGEQSLLSAETLERIRADMRKGLPCEQPPTIEAEFKVIEEEEPADPSTDQLDKLIKCKADIERIKRQLKEVN